MGLNLVTREFGLVTHGFELATRGLELVTREFGLVTRGFELVTHISELVTCVLLFHDWSEETKHYEQGSSAPSVNNLCLTTRRFSRPI